MAARCWRAIWWSKVLPDAPVGVVVGGVGLGLTLEIVHAAEVDRQILDAGDVISSQQAGLQLLSALNQVTVDVMPW